MSSVIRIELLQEVHSAVVTQKRRADRDALCCLLSKSGKKARGSSHPCMRDHHRPQRIILLRKMLKEGSDIVDAMEEIDYSNRTFTFQVKTPTTSWFIRRCAKINQGSSRPGHDIAGKIHVKRIYEIAEVKKHDEHLAKESLLAFFCRSIAPSCLSRGDEVVAN
eukprot:gene11323-12635_t